MIPDIQQMIVLFIIKHTKFKNHVIFLKIKNPGFVEMLRGSFFWQSDFKIISPARVPADDCAVKNF